MSVSTTGNRISYSGNGTSTVFSFPYYFLADTDLVVILRNNSTGVEVVQTLTSNYTVSGVGADAGGSVTMLVAPATGYTVTIYRDPPLIQDLKLVENDPLPATEVMKRFDKLTMIAQRLKSRVDRALGLSEGYTATFDPSLPKVLTAKASLVINDTGDGIALGLNPADAVTAAAASATAALASQTAAATSQSAAATSASAASTSATNALTSETNAAYSAGSAAAALASAFFRDVVFITAANSPFTITQAHNGKLIDVDASAGAITITLPTIGAISLPFNVAVRMSFSGNTISINRGGTNTIDQINTTTSLVTAGTGMLLAASTNISPSNWSTFNFATVADASVTPAKLATSVKTALIPSGAVIPYGGASAPTGFLLCDGSAVSRTTYSDLYTAIGTAFGAGNGTTTFNLPNTAGIFIQGAGTQTISSKSFAAGTLGTSSRDSTALPVNAITTGTESTTHIHQESYGNSGGSATGVAGFFNFASQAYTSNYTNSQSANHTHTLSSGGDTYTKPGSIVFNHIIKY